MTRRTFIAAISGLIYGCESQKSPAPVGIEPPRKTELVGQPTPAVAPKKPPSSKPRAGIREEDNPHKLYRDYVAAVKEAKSLDIPLLLWIACDPSDTPYAMELYDSLKGEAVHCWLPEQFPGEAHSPRIVLRDTNYKEWFVPIDKIRPSHIGKIRRLWSPRKTYHKPFMGAKPGDALI